MKMRSLLDSKIDPKNLARLLNWLVYFAKGFRSFHTCNMGSVGQMAAKLLAFKVGGLKKSLPSGPGPTGTGWLSFDSDRV